VSFKAEPFVTAPVYRRWASLEAWPCHSLWRCVLRLPWPCPFFRSAHENGHFQVATEEHMKLSCRLILGWFVFHNQRTHREEANSDCYRYGREAEQPPPAEGGHGHQCQEDRKHRTKWPEYLMHTNTPIRRESISTALKSSSDNKTSTVPRSAGRKSLSTSLGGILSTASPLKRDQTIIANHFVATEMCRSVHCRLQERGGGEAVELTTEEFLRDRSRRGLAGTRASRTPEQRHSAGRRTESRSY